MDEQPELRVAPPLETTREFGLEQLASNGELETRRRRHAEHYRGLAEEAEPALWGPTAGTWLARLEAEHDNLRAALDWGLGPGGEAGRGLALRLAGALARFWWTRGHFAEGLDWLERALSHAVARSAARMKALYGAAWLAHFLRDSSRARALLDESLAIAGELQDEWAETWVLHVLGRVAYFDGDHERARALGEHSLANAERLADRELIGWALHLLGLAAHVADDLDRAEELYEQSLVIRRELGHRESVGVLCHLMGMAAQRQGDYARASRLYREYLAIARELGSTWHSSNVLAQVGSLAAAQGQPAHAARLIGAAAVVHEVSGTRPIPLTEHLVAEGANQARRALGEAAYAKADAAGRAMSAHEAVAEALEVIEAPASSELTDAAEAPGVLPGLASISPLTGREQQVAALIARGLTNRQIAEDLVIAERTAEAHVTHILNKLGFVSRTQIGVWAARELPAPANPQVG